MLHKIKWVMVLFLVYIPYALADITEAHIKSDRGDFNYKTGVLIYLGHVLVTQPDSKLEADKMINYLDAQHKLKKAVAEGNPAHFWQAAKEGRAEFHAYAKRIEFYPTEHMVILIGDGKLVSQGHVLHAPYITYDTLEQRLITKAVGIQRTTIIITHKK
jgi:lipopolysaccharide transport protein LptA